MAHKMFGEMLHELRMRKEITLRRFCQMTGLDPGNVSRWERGVTNPPQNDTLKQIAAILGLEDGTSEYDEFISCANISSGRIPRKVMNDKELLERLPVFFRTLEGKKLTREQLDSLIERIREEL